MDEEKRSAEIRLTKAESDDPAVEANAGNRKKSGLKYGTVSHVFRIIPLFLQTLPLGNNHKERKKYESNRHRPPGGRFGKNCHPQGNQKNPENPRGWPAVNIIDREGTVCLRGWKPGKQNFFIEKLRNLHCIPKKAKYFKKGVAKRDTLSICDGSEAARW